MARDEPMIRFRLPEALKTRLEAAHLANDRSLNAEIRMRLEWSFEAGFDGNADRTLASEIEDLRRAVDDLRTRLKAQEHALSILKDVCQESGIGVGVEF